MNLRHVLLATSFLSLASTIEAGELPSVVFAKEIRPLSLPRSPFVDGSYGLRLPRAILMAKEPPEFLPRNLMAYSPEDETQDLIFFSEDRPIVLRNKIFVDGRGFRLAWGEFAHRLYLYLDRNDDGVLTLKEASTGNGIQALLSGGPFQRGAPQNNANAGPKLDEDKDERVSFAELIAFLNVRFSPFAVQPGFGADPRSEAVFNHLDVNRDRKLSRPEVDAAEAVLRRFDLDEDDTLTVAELGPSQGRFGNQRRFNNMNGANALSAFSIHSGEPLGPVAAALIARYDRPNDPAIPGSKDGKLGPLELRIDRGVFDRSDKNKDGLLETAEVQNYLEKAGSDLGLTFRVELKTGRGTIELTSSADGTSSLASMARKVGNELVDLDLDSIKAALKVQASRKNPNGFDARQFFLSTFQGADADGNNELDKTELAQAQFLNQILPIADRNADGKLKESELIAYLDITDYSGWSRTTLSVSDLGHALFNHLDHDHDQRLGAREVRQAWRVLQADDRDKDGRVSAREIPRHFLFALGRGQANSQFFGFVDGDDEEEPVTTGVDPAPSAPTWFTRMDQNRDGDLTPREFLGSLAEFRRIDADHDGLISPAEAASVK